MGQNHSHRQNEENQWDEQNQQDDQRIHLYCETDKTKTSHISGAFYDTAYDAFATFTAWRRSSEHRFSPGAPVTIVGDAIGFDADPHLVPGAGL